MSYPSGVTMGGKAGGADRTGYTLTGVYVDTQMQIFTFLNIPVVSYKL